MTLPTNIDATYPDESSGDALHQQHHDVIHGAVNRIPDDGSAVVTETTGSAAYARTRGANAGASGHYFAAMSGALSTGAPALNLLTVHPLDIGEAVTLDRIGIEVTTAAASSFCRLGLYADHGGKPGALLLDAGQVDASTTGVKEITISQALNPGVVWLAYVSQGGTPTVRRSSSELGLPGIGNATAATVSANPMAAMARTGVSGALLDPFGSNQGGQVYQPRVIVRVA